MRNRWQHCSIVGESASFSCHIVSGVIGQMKWRIVSPEPHFQVLTYIGTITSNLSITDGSETQVMYFQCLLVFNDTAINLPPISLSPVAVLTIIKSGKFFE